MSVAPAVSILIPLFDEEENLRPLFDRLRETLDGNSIDAELLFVDDGSRDESAAVLEALRAEDPRVRVIRLRRNLGKSIAMAVGFRRSRGEVIVTLDADLQDDPAEIPRFLDAIAAGADVVAGWRRTRHDPWNKLVASRIYNAVTRVVTGIDLHDFNCGLKAFRRERVGELRIYGDLHRYVVVLAASQGARIQELEVEHHERHRGLSKYGAARWLHGFLDLLTVVFLTRYDRRPLHFLGGAGFLLTAVGVAVNAYLSVLWVLGYGPIGTRPLLALGVLLVALGVQFIFFGLLAEFVLSLHARDDNAYLDGVVDE